MAAWPLYALKMPRELPGFYFDARKNRYFPLSSKKDARSHSSESQSQLAAPLYVSASSPRPLAQTPQRSLDIWHALQRLRLAGCQRQSVAATIHLSGIPVPVYAGQTLTAFAAGIFDGHAWSVAGDSYGVLHTLDPLPTRDFLSMPNHTPQYSWTRRTELESRLMGETSGVRQRALFVQDIERVSDVRRIETQSDVFAVHQEENLVYTGSRNGSIRRFDTRTRAIGPSLLSDVFAKSSNSVVYLNIIKDWQLLVSTIRGVIEIFDVRYLQENRPIFALLGHVNSYQPSLPHAITPRHDYFFAAGLDNRIRGWSLLTGEPLSCPVTSSASTLEIPGHQPHAVDVHASLFAAKFEEQITSLEITQVGQELCLFATSGSGLHRFIFGRRVAD
ncbi:hypothetical protein B0F90DRAFT_1815779 [Multifurca ochricompacta]|uniref:WD40 repeat-like protein n=1 Tax=Multifurca ochricompacta TaxID=376703 RepID=A0AAD4M9I2_9AGAM|nr:hypothetical protein B0F90DRAFT_1815779 [Multifurca ochricompacta]